jgi:hypothetical protein
MKPKIMMNVQIVRVTAFPGAFSGAFAAIVFSPCLPSPASPARTVFHSQMKPKIMMNVQIVRVTAFPGAFFSGAFAAIVFSPSLPSPGRTPSSNLTEFLLGLAGVPRSLGPLGTKSCGVLRLRFAGSWLAVGKGSVGGSAGLNFVDGSEGDDCGGVRGGEDVLGTERLACEEADAEVAGSVELAAATGIADTDAGAGADADAASDSPFTFFASVFSLPFATPEAAALAAARAARFLADLESVGVSAEGSGSDGELGGKSECFYRPLTGRLMLHSHSEIVNLYSLLIELLLRLVLDLLDVERVKHVALDVGRHDGL